MLVNKAIWRFFSIPGILNATGKMSSLARAERTLGIVLQKRNTILREAKAIEFCEQYQLLDKTTKEDLLKNMAIKHDIDAERVKSVAQSFLVVQNEDSQRSHHQTAERLKAALSPRYVEIFAAISRLDFGVKFLVDMRADLVELLKKKDFDEGSSHHLKSLSRHLKEFLSFSFNIGFLTLQRITWESSCLMLQKISDYEAVHPVRNWTDLKRRVGPYRRCFVFTHTSMPREPVVVLHTALTEDISSSIHSIVRSIEPTELQLDRTEKEIGSQVIEDPDKIHAVIFYSISTTQKGLAGFDLGNQLIKKVSGEILKEFPQIKKLSSLSPIPGFRDWLLMEIRKIQQGSVSVLNLFFLDAISSLCKVFQVNGTDEVCDSLAYQIASNQWTDNEQLKCILHEPLMKTCAHYLYREKRRSYALNSVAHFHLQNGAVLWRLNWEADLSPGGLTNSCGIMVNYRYFLEKTQENSQKYIEDYYINLSEEVSSLLTPLSNKSCL